MHSHVRKYGENWERHWDTVTHQQHRGKGMVGWVPGSTSSLPTGPLHGSGGPVAMRVASGKILIFYPFSCLENIILVCSDSF